MFKTSGAGIDLVTSAASMQNNDIAPANAGIEFNGAANPSVLQNTMNEARRGADQVPTGLAVTNTYCSSASPEVRS